MRIDESMRLLKEYSYVVSILTESSNPRNYWNMLKTRLEDDEQSELSTKCVQLKLKAKDGKFRMTDTLDTKGI